MCISYFFYVFHCFSPYSIIYSVCVSFSTLFIFLNVLQVLHCAFLIFHINVGFRHISRSNSVCVPFSIFFQVSRHIPCPTRWFSHFLSWSVFLPYSRSYSVHFSFFTYFDVSPIFYILPCLCLIFHIFQFSPHNPNLQCTFLIFHLIHCFSPYSRLYKVCASFWTFLFFCLFVFSPHSRSYSVYFSFLIFFNVSLPYFVF